MVSTPDQSRVIVEQGFARTVHDFLAEVQATANLWCDGCNLSKRHLDEASGAYNWDTPVVGRPYALLVKEQVVLGLAWDLGTRYLDY